MPSETATQKPATGKIVVRTLIAAVGAAIINNLYSVAYTAITGFSIPDVINFTTVTLFSVGPVILGGLVYWIASRFNVKVANIGLAIGTVALFIAFSIPSFGGTIMTAAGTQPAPDGFVPLSMGLHFASPILLLALVPQWRRSNA